MIGEGSDSMNCKDFQLYSSAYIDNMLSDKDKLSFENHIKECKNCRIALSNLKLIVESTNKLEEIGLPESFSKELGEKLKKLEGPKSNFLFRGKKILRNIAAALLIAIISLSLINKFSNYNKEAQFYSGRQGLSEDERINLHIASEEAEMEPEDTIDGGQPIMPFKMAPVEEEAGMEDREAVDRKSRSYPMEAHDASEFSEDKDKEEEISVDREELEALPSKNIFDKIANPIYILALATGLIYLIYRIWKK